MHAAFPCTSKVVVKFTLTYFLFIFHSLELLIEKNKCEFRVLSFPIFTIIFRPSTFIITFFVYKRFFRFFWKPTGARWGQGGYLIFRVLTPRVVRVRWMYRRRRAGAARFVLRIFIRVWQREFPKIFKNIGVFCFVFWEGGASEKWSEVRRRTMKLVLKWNIRFSRKKSE